MAVIVADVVRELRELIVALDRRLPHLERAAEAGIAHDAALLRAQAVNRLAEIAGRSVPDAEVPCPSNS